MTVIAGFFTMLFNLAGWLLYAAAGTLTIGSLSAQWILPGWHRQSFEQHRTIRALGAGAAVVMLTVGGILVGIAQAIAR